MRKKVNPDMTKMLELIDKDFKTAIINLDRNLKECIVI